MRGTRGNRDYHATGRFNRVVALVLLTLGALAACAQPAKPDPKDAPRLTFATPFVVKAGATTRITVRGQRLETVTEVRCHEPKGRARLVGKSSKASVPSPALLPSHGDEQIDVEITLPPGITHRDVTLTAINPSGESKPLRLRVDDELTPIAEKEVNNGFANAQAVAVGQAVNGVIQGPQDVDVYALDGQAGQRLLITAQASRYGSPVEPYLTVFDAQGRTLRASDDVGRDEDARLHLTLPRTGGYYLSVVDFHDQGGEHFRYRLTIEAEK